MNKLNFGPLTRACTKPNCTIQTDHICVDQSELGVERSCQTKEYFSYGLQLQSKAIPSPKNPFLHGTICHHAMETLYHANHWRDLKAAEHAGFDEFSKFRARDPFSEEGDNNLNWAALWSEVKDCIHRYYEYSEEADAIYEPLAPETSFSICLKETEPQVYFYGKFDNPVIRNDGKIVIMEFKFHAQMSEDPLYLEWDPQTTDYSFTGGEVFGKEWGGIDYRITRKIASPKLVNFVRKTPEELARNYAQMQMQKRFVVVQALQILRHRKLGPISLVPAQSNHPISVANECYGCEFRSDLCSAFQEGDDWKTIAQLNYQSKEQYADYVEVNKLEESKELKVF